MGRAVFIPYDDKTWFDYYLGQAKQTGHGIDGFQGIQYQRGSGLGSLFGRLFRFILPVAKRFGKSALKTVGKEAANAGAHILGDVVQGQNIKQSLKQHGRKAAGNLINKAGSVVLGQSGGRIGKRKVVSKVSSVPTKKRRGGKKSIDIFNNGKNY